MVTLETVTTRPSFRNLQQMKKLGISMTDHRYQIAACEECNRLEQEGMADRNYQTSE